MNLYSVKYGDLLWLGNTSEAGKYRFTQKKNERALFYTRSLAVKAIRNHVDNMSINMNFASDIITSYFEVVTEKFAIEMDDVLITHPIR